MRAVVERALLTGSACGWIRSRGRALFLLAALVMLGAGEARGQWSTDPEHAIRLDGIYDVALTTDSLGGVFIPGTSDNYATYCYWFDLNGVGQWEHWLPVAPLALYSTHSWFSLCTEPRNFVMTYTAYWTSERGDTIHDLRAQKINTNGEFLWPDSGVAISSLNHIVSSEYQDSSLYVLGIVGAEAGGVYVVYASYYTGGQFARKLSQVFVQKINRNGEVQWGPDGIQVPCESADRYYRGIPGESHCCSVVPDNRGGLTIAFTILDEEAGGIHLKLQRLASDGAYLWGDEGITFSLDNGAGIQSAESTVDGGIVLCLTNGAGPNRFLDAFRFDGNGNQVWGDGNGLRLFNVDRHDARQIPDGYTVKANDSTFFFNWNTSDIDTLPMVQSVSFDGRIRWHEGGLPVSEACFRQSDSHGIGSENSVIYGWYDVRNHSGQLGPSVYVQRFDANGQQLWGENDVCILKGSHLIWDVISDMRGGAIFYAERYLQHVNRNGELGVVLEVPPIDDPLNPLLTGFQLFPNPANNYVMIQSYSPADLKRELLIYDITGRTMLRTPMFAPQSKYMIDLSNYSTGSYFIDIEANGKSERKTLQIVK